MESVSLLRLLPAIVLAWLAFFFGRTLRPGRMALIERIARVGDPDMPECLCAYTRRLTAVWVAYFLFAAVAVVLARASPGATSAAVWLGTILLFVGEHRARPHLFPGRNFPGLLQQVRDTWSVWHPRERLRD
jgi:uncharacterized membrane protein